MDYSVIRPKPPAKKPTGPPPKPPSSAPPPSQPPPPPAPPQKPPPPHIPVRPYMEELDRVSRLQRLRSVEYTNARTWRMNFGEYPNDYYDHYGNYEYNYNRHPVGVHNYDHHGPLPRLGLPPPDYHHALPGPPPRLALPQPDSHHVLPGPSPRLALPPPDYHHGPPGPPPALYYYPPPYHGGFFSDENPNGCMIM
ncbi:hypothetical protein CDL12_01065 [Handroanthus impetiginosus]|uniref:Uncharacterized protein n=1 Tax=Handroanthus impetiginosus TaxID=429701 RepID=A0A2G9I8V2_9LAMI|nr:hypothetical protein CDL12_01065 [Handroanthus impetiginosus]